MRAPKDSLKPQEASGQIKEQEPIKVIRMADLRALRMEERRKHRNRKIRL